MKRNMCGVIHMIMQKTINRPWLRVLCVCMVLCMLVGMLPATGSAATPSKLYLMPNSNWTMDGARFAAYFFGNGEKWVSGVKLSNGMYEFAVPSGYPNVIFCRMNGSAAANNWSNKWNQTGDLKVPTNGNNLYTVPSGSWDGGTAQWGKFDPCGNLGHKFANNICSVCGAKECDVNGHKFENDICGICGHARYMNIYFRNDWFWSNVTVHFWGTDTDIGTAFPGAAMTLYDNDGTYDYYVLKVPTDIDGLLFVGNKNDAPDVQDQSPDVNSGWYDGIVYYMHWDGGNKVSSFDICDVVFPCKHPNQKPVSGHEATCTQTGLTDGIVCVDCGETIKAQDEIPAKGHNWNDATCTVAKTCSVCGTTEGEALGHSEPDYINNGDGTHAELWPCCNKIVIAAEEHVDTNGQDGRCDECHGLVHPAYLRQVSVSLKGNIALNYYMLLSEEVLADETAYMQFTMADGEVIKLPVSQGVEQSYQGETYYVFTCAVSAKEMTDTVLSQFFYDGGVTREHTYSVQTYAKHILTNYDDAAIKDLITSMLNYGAASQLHFGYNTDKLANADLEAPDYSNVTIDGFKPVAGQGTELAKLYSASLILKSETTLRIFFKVDAAVENLTVTYQGQALEVKQRSGLSYVDVVGISAKALDEVVTVTVNDGANTAEVAFNPMSYSQGVLNDTTGAFGQDMKDLVAALYLYNKAANVYFKEV